MKKRGYYVAFLIISAASMVADESWGSWNGQLRLYSMIEDNQDPLLDYAGTAIGAKILYQTPQWENFQGLVGVYSSAFIHDNVTSDRLEPLASNRGSRYVAGLVDTTNLDNNRVAGIGEAYLHYSIPHVSLLIGRIKLDTPCINSQDGRMIPTLEQGAWGTVQINPNWSAQAGYINGFWNRNTPAWKSVEDSIGYGYEMGISPEGLKGDYYENTSSKGIFTGNIRYKDSSFKIDIWDYYVENIFNLGYIETLYTQHTDGIKLIYAIQAIYENEVGDGGNNEDNGLDATNAQKAKSYLSKGEKSTTYGAKIAVENQESRVTLAYNRTADQGRFLFPREWGKEPLYTFQKRERSDGSGHSNAWLITLEHDFTANGLAGFSMIAGYGEYDKSDPKEWKFNKYGTPSYAQWNIDLFYHFRVF